MAVYLDTMLIKNIGRSSLVNGLNAKGNWEVLIKETIMVWLYVHVRRWNSYIVEHIVQSTYQMHAFCICGRIYKKGSNTHTTSAHRFHHHSMDTSLDYPCVHVLWPTVYQSALPEATF